MVSAAINHGALLSASIVLIHREICAALSLSALSRSTSLTCFCRRYVCAVCLHTRSVTSTTRAVPHLKPWPLALVCARTSTYTRGWGRALTAVVGAGATLVPVLAIAGSKPSGLAGLVASLASLGGLCCFCPVFVCVLLLLPKNPLLPLFAALTSWSSRYLALDMPPKFPVARTPFAF